MQIIDRDINSYIGFAEKAQSDLRNCLPKDEAKHRKVCILYNSILINMKTLRNIINNNEE